MRLLALLALFSMAVLCYFIGSATGALIFLFVGVVLELMFWLKLIKTTS